MHAAKTVNWKLTIAGVAMFFMAFFSFALAREKDEKLELPFSAPYDDIGDYDYPYLIPPPKMFSVGNLGYYNKQGQQEENDDNTPKLFYVVKPSEPNIYWKERTYDVYTGQGWLIQNVDTRDKEKNAKSLNAPVRFDIYKFLKKGNYNLDLIIPFTNQSTIDGNSFEINPDNKFDLTLNVYGDGIFAIDIGSDTNIKYQAAYYPPDFDIKKAGELKDAPKKIAEAYTKLPDEFPRKLKDIADDLAKKSNRNLTEQILNTYKFVQDNVEYDLKWGEGETIPKDYDMALWTYENKKGICSHFATLFIVLARAQNIPSRLAVGFAGGKVVGESAYIYSSYAHGWAEIYLPNFGWVPIDPTKGARGEDGQQGGEQEKPSEWSNGGNVRPDLRFTLDDQFQKEKDKNKQDGSGNNGGQNSNGSDYNSDFTGNPNQLSELDKWFENDDAKKLEEKYENWLKEQKQSIDNNNGENGDRKDGENGSDKNNGGDDKNKNEKDKKNEDKNEKKDSGLITDIKNAVANIAKNSSKTATFVVIILTLLFSALYFVFKKYARMETVKKKIEERIKSINRFVNIDEVIKKVKLFGSKEEYNAAIVYGYNKLEDYIAYVLDIINDPALTAREFENLVRKINLFKSLSIIVENFERAKYSSLNSKEDYDVFLAALCEIAIAGRTKK